MIWRISTIAALDVRLYASRPLTLRQRPRGHYCGSTTFFDLGPESPYLSRHLFNSRFSPRSFVKTEVNSMDSEQKAQAAGTVDTTGSNEHPGQSSTSEPTSNGIEIEIEQVDGFGRRLSDIDRQYAAQTGVERRIHIVGTGSIGKLVAHSLRGLPEPPPVDSHLPPIQTPRGMGEERQGRHP